MHALAQPTPLGNGPKGFTVVLNDAIIITEKVCSSHHDIQLAESFNLSLDEMGIQPPAGHNSVRDQAISGLFLQTNLPWQCVRLLF